MTSLIQSAGNKMVAFTVVYSRLLKFEFQLTIRTNISNENLNIYTERLTGRETYKREKMEVDRQTNSREREIQTKQNARTSVHSVYFPPFSLQLSSIDGDWNSRLNKQQQKHSSKCSDHGVDDEVLWPGISFAGIVPVIWNKTATSSTPELSMYIINIIKIGHTFCSQTIIKQDELLQLLENNSTNKHKTAAW